LTRTQYRDFFLNSEDLQWKFKVFTCTKKSVLFNQETIKRIGDVRDW